MDAHTNESLEIYQANRGGALLNYSLKRRMETSADRRKRKLQHLCKWHERQGGLQHIADTSGVNFNTLDQVIKGSLLPAKKDGTRSPRMLGKDAAARIEDAFSLGRGWFDADDGFDDFEAIPPPLPLAALLAQLGEHMARIDPSQRASLGAMLNTWALEGGTPDLTAVLVNRLAPAKQTPAELLDILNNAAVETKTFVKDRATQ